MVRESVYLMAVLDLAAIFVVVVAGMRICRIRRESAAGVNFRGIGIILAGLTALGLFFVIDFSMFRVLPIAIGEARAVNAVVDLNLNWSWMLLVGGLALVAAGFVIFVKRHEALAEGEAVREDALRANDQNFRYLVEHSIQGILVHHSSRPIFANDALAEMFGYDDPAGILDLADISVLFDASELERVHDYGGRRLRGEPVPSKYRCQMNKRDGTRFWVDLVSNLVEWSGKTCILVAFVDVTEEVELEGRLRATELRLISAVEGMQFPLALYDESDRLVICNQPYRDNLGSGSDILQPGASFEEIVRARVASGMHPDAVDDPESFIRERLEKHRRNEGPLLLRRLDGRISQVFDEKLPDGARLHLSLDVTDMKTVERDLRESERQFQDFAETASDWLWEMDESYLVSDLVAVNSDINRDYYFGKTRWELAGADPESDPHWRAHKETLDRRESFQNFEYWRENEHGESVCVVANGKPFFDDVGVFRGYRGTAINATAHRRAEMELREVEELFRAMLDYSPAMIVIRDIEGRFERINRAYEQAHGVANETIAGKTAHDLFNSETADIIANQNRRVLETGAPLVEEHEQQFVDRMGTVISARFPIRDAHGKVKRIGTISTDITERKKMEVDLRLAKEEAEGANRAKSEFLAKMSHELRTPLNAIIGFAQVLNQEVFGSIANERYKDYAHDIFVSGQHLLSLISDLLDISKIESGELSLDLDEFAIDEVLADVLTFLEPEMKAKRHRFTPTLTANLPKLRADRRAVQQILINLMSNSIKFTEPGGELQLSAVMNGGDSLRIEIADNGIGIPSDEIDTIVTPFVQARARPENPEIGTGLGLSIVDALVGLHGGRLEIESVLGEGTKVAVYLPVVD